MTTGARRLIEMARDAGIDTCFANPGTTEVSIVDALDAVGGMRSVLALFEGVVSGAADGYARIAGKPAMTLLHLGAGLANSLANLHNARRARSPVVNVVGEHTTWHRAIDSPLRSDIEGMARTVSDWVCTVGSPGELAANVDAAIGAALGPPGQVATLVVPMDVQWSEIPPTAGDGCVRPGPGPVTDDMVVVAAADAFRSRPLPTLVLGGGALTERGIRAAARIEKHIGCTVLVETFPARVERGCHLPWFRSVPYFPERAREVIGDAPLVLAGADLPVNMFGARDGSSRPVPSDVEYVSLGDVGSNVAEGLEQVADRLGAPPGEPVAQRTPRPIDRSSLNPRSVGGVIASMLPEAAIVVDEGGTGSYGYVAASPSAAPHTCIGLTGGAIGSGMPMAVGASIAAPGRRVVALQADGSGMYTNQGIWTLAREGLDVTIVVLANRRYAILETEFQRAGVGQPGPVATALTSLSRPDIDWVSLARGMGVPGRCVSTVDEFEKVVNGAMAEPGPFLIEVEL